ncbi:MAG: alpha/beta hydrolase, partial [Micromonosporaceae bacterium]
VTLHPQTVAALGAQPSVPLTRENLAASRASMRDAIGAEVGPTRVMVPVVRDVDAGGVPCRLYDPRHGHGAPVVIFAHGGGWALGDLDTHDGLCRRLADRSGCAVLSVAYRLAPEHPWPAAIEDVETAVEWLRAGAAEHGVDATRCAIAGDSAGGHLAAVVARRARDAGQPYAYQVLFNPVIDPVMATESYREYTGYGLSAGEMRFFWDAFCPPGVDRDQPDVSPLTAELAGLPPALVITAEYDPLCDEGEAYAMALAAAGVPAVLVRYQGINHGFVRKLAIFDAAGAAIDQAATALAAALA